MKAMKNYVFSYHTLHFPEDQLYPRYLLHKCDVIIYNEFIVRTDTAICTFIASFYDNTWIEFSHSFSNYHSVYLQFHYNYPFGDRINFTIKNEIIYNMNKLKSFDQKIYIQYF